MDVSGETSSRRQTSCAQIMTGSEVSTWTITWKSYRVLAWWSRKCATLIIAMDILDKAGTENIKKFMDANCSLMGLWYFCWIFPCMPKSSKFKLSDKILATQGKKCKNTHTHTRPEMPPCLRYLNQRVQASGIV